MNSILVYIEINESGRVADVSLELCSKGRRLADRLGGQLEAIVAGNNLADLEQQLYPYGVDTILYANDPRLSPYRTLPHFSIVDGIIRERQPEVVLYGATSVGRDLAPRIASHLRCGLTADCTALEIGDHTDLRTGKEYHDILYQIRPAFGGNIVATIVSPETRPQMATVREGVMRKEIVDANHKGQLINIDAAKYLRAEDDCLKVISRQIDPQGVDIKGASIIVAGGYGMGSRENFDMLYKFANMIGGEVGASRAAIDAGFCDNDRRHLRRCAAPCRHGAVGSDYLHQHRPRCTHQLHCRLHHYRRRVRDYPPPYERLPVVQKIITLANINHELL